MMNLLHHCLTAITICKPGISAFSTSQQLDQTTVFAADLVLYKEFGNLSGDLLMVGSSCVGYWKNFGKMKISFMFIQIRG